MELSSVSLFIEMFVSIALQDRDDRQEEIPPEPCTSPINVASRIFLEQ